MAVSCVAARPSVCTENLVPLSGISAVGPLDLSRSLPPSAPTRHREPRRARHCTALTRQTSLKSKLPQIARARDYPIDHCSISKHVHVNTTFAVCTENLTATSCDFAMLWKERSGTTISRARQFEPCQSALGRSPHPWRTPQARHRRRPDLSRQVHGAAKTTSLARLENVPPQPCRRDRLNRPLRGSDDLIQVIVRPPNPPT